jgi:outer membrane immunogenic protein
MHRIVHACAPLAFALICQTAMAADVLPFATPAGSYYWQGPYVGANLGLQWGRVSNSPTRPMGAAGGLQGGYNWQRGTFVFGVEADLQGSSADDRFAPWKFSNPWFGTLRGRAGYAMNNILLYGTFGLAYGALHARNTAAGVSEWKTEVGWAAGAGLEVAMTRNWTARAEYLYVDLDERPYLLTGQSHGIDSSLLRFGVNYRF